MSEIKSLVAMVEVMQNNGKSYEPSKVHWFEFLLDDTLLEKHLQSSYPGAIIPPLLSFVLYNWYRQVA